MGAFTLSVRYNSQIIASFALIGGYLPVISLLESSHLVYGAMIYLAALNLFALSISWGRKWRVTTFIGLSFNILGAAFICLYNTAPELNYAAAIIYAAFAFSIYTAIPVVSTYHTKTKFRKSDIVLLAINTVFGSMIMYGVFVRFDMQNYAGLLAITLAVVYILLNMVIENKFSKEEKLIKTLFFLTSITFVILIIPMQFGRVWLSLGWLVQGVILAVYGILRDEKRFRKAGLIICGLCLGAFLIFDLARYSWLDLFVWKYTAITAGSLIILGVYMYKKMMSGKFASIYKYFVLVNFWFYSIYVIQELGLNLFNIYSGMYHYQINYLISAASITATFIIAYAVTRIKLLHEFGIKILSIVFYSFGIIWLLIINGIYSPFTFPRHRVDAPDAGLTVIGVTILVVLSVLSILAMRDAMKIIITKRKKGIEWLPLVVSGYFIVLLSQNLVMQFNLSFSSAVISIIYVLAALAWIVYGFMRRFAFIRRFGLALAIFAVAKLFLVDLSGLTQGYRIISYFALGITLLAISFVYQYFSKKLEMIDTKKIV